MSIRLVIVMTIGTVAGWARSARAQAAHDEAAVRSAVRQVLLGFRYPVDSSREGTDSASVWQRFVRCDVRDGRSVCALDGGRSAMAITVRLVTPDSAEVRVQNFQMQYEVCPGGPALKPPIINGNLGFDHMAPTYRDGRWLQVGQLEVTTC